MMIGISSHIAIAHMRFWKQANILISMPLSNKPYKILSSLVALEKP